MNDLDIVCLPADLPEYIAVDISGLRLGDTITLAEVVLPEGVESQILNADGDSSSAVVHIAAPQVESAPIEGGEEESEVATDDSDSAEGSDGEEESTLR